MRQNLIANTTCEAIFDGAGMMPCGGGDFSYETRRRPAAFATWREAAN
jgi:hypothetical protein